MLRDLQIKNEISAIVVDEMDDTCKIKLIRNSNNYSLDA